METMFWIAFQWILLAFLASIISIRPGTTLMMSTGLTFGTIFCFVWSVKPVYYQRSV